MFFDKPEAIVYLKRTSVEMYIPKIAEGIVCMFPKTVVTNLEIIDHEQFKKLLIEFLHNHAIPKQNGLMVLAEDVLFEKKVPIVQPEKEAAVIEDFYSSIPLEPQTIAKKVLLTNTQLVLYATDKILYESTKKVLEEMGWKICAVVPLSIYVQKKAEEKLTESDRTLILQNDSSKEPSNFLQG